MNQPRLSPLDRLLRLFADVRAGEGPTAVLMMVNIFLVMFAYYVIKVAREPLILDFPSEIKGSQLRSYAVGAQAIVLLVVLPAYSWLTSALSTRRLLFTVVGFFILCLELFAGALLFDFAIGFVFFVWVGIFNLSVVALFWSFANEVYSREAGERLFPVIGIGMTGGAWAGSALAGGMFGEEANVSTVLQVAAALLLSHFLFYWVILGRPEVRGGLGAAPTSAAKKGLRDAFEGFALVVQNPYVLWFALLILLLNLVNTTGEYILSEYIVDAVDAELSGAGSDAEGALRKARIGEAYGYFYLGVNVLGFVLQAFVASRLIKFFGIGGVLFALPIVAGGAYLLGALGVGFAVFRWAKTAENATDYSVMNTARAMLWLPTSREEKYKAKQTVDTLVVRIGDLLSAGFVFLGSSLLELSVQNYASINVVLVAVWLGLAWLLVRSYRNLAQT